MQQQSYLVFDSNAAEAQIAKKFRINNDLQASASGQFSADELPKILKAIPTERQKIWIVDLRQESHGFIDGLPVSWVGDRNYLNKDKSGSQIAREEKNLLKTVSTKKTVIVYALKKLANGKLTTELPTTMIPEQIETEQELVSSLSAQYARIYVLDHNKPDDAEVDNFIYFIKHKVRDQDWLHFHCRGGKGRSSTFIALYDMIKNVQNCSFEEIIARQAEIDNKKLDDLPTSADKVWKTGEARERYAFMRKFYDYVKDPQGYNARTWSDWLRLQNQN